MINQNLPGMKAQFLQLMIERPLMTDLMDLVHLKFGNAAFEELIVLDLQQIDEFFWKYLHWSFSVKLPLANQVRALVRVLQGLPDHADISVYFPTTLGAIKDGTIDPRNIAAATTIQGDSATRLNAITISDDSTGKSEESGAVPSGDGSSSGGLSDAPEVSGGPTAGASQEQVSGGGSSGVDASAVEK